MKRCWVLPVVVLTIAGGLGCGRARLSKLTPGKQDVRQIPVAEYVDKMKAGWIGQMAGVGWGGPTEFRYNGVIIPEDEMPEWTPGLINQFHQDDLYVEMTFLRTLELHGFDVSIRQAGIDFANSGYQLWHANKAGRDNLRSGIAPPDSGHPKFNKHADDIDYQIEADFAGLIAPGMPNVAIQLGEKFGRLMNYGDGLYGGQFVSGMYAEAFFETDIIKIIEAGLRCIPKESQYHECITDVLRWYAQHPDDWTKTWQLVNEKYHLNPAYRRFSCTGPESDFNIDAKINGAYIVMGLLYGQGDPDQTIIISTRCGQDSDCNPSNAAGILFTTIGFRDLPEKYKIALDPWGKFSHTPYNFPTLIRVCEDLARDAVVNSGGKIQTSDQGEECFVIPVQSPRPSRLERSWAPGPADETRYSKEEMAKITALLGKDLSEAIGAFAPGWKVVRCGEEMAPGLRAELRGRRNVLVTHPLNPEIGCVISRTVELPANRDTVLELVVGHDPRGDWDLIVNVDGKELRRKTIGPETTTVGWTDVAVDLSPYAGRAVKIELVNEPTGWRYEAAFWAEISLASR
ncbi:ADP-ribosylglycohydrolase family protein [Anaerobaca lacustris]|uniref:ADP-ribosylglycohydrolase family protein n=1 Tax=Anaerobaca lacustris TaxID=3044600 RepID=A0AAW6U4J1_9BACT|nr:ADP-ribosylglycohydrolase family protein [Sedimentisphaerales bacterium M17dextr]